MPITLAVVLGLSACAAPTAGLHRYGPAGYVQLAVADGFTPASPIDTTASDSPGRLTGPHYSLQATGYSVSRSVSAVDAARYGFGGGPVHATKGTEFFLAVFGEGHAEPGATAELLVDGEATTLDRVPTHGETVAAVIPTDAPVLLRVTDADRSQTLDLRDGSRTEQIDAYYNAALRSQDPDDYKAKGKATGRPGGAYEPAQRSVSVSMAIGAAERAPWIDAKGWADDGKVWVSVPISDITTDAVYGFDTSEDSHEPMLYWKFAQDDVFSLNPDKGKKTTAAGNPTFTADVDSTVVPGSTDVRFDPVSVDLIFEVSEDATAATFTVAPTGKLTAVWKNVNGVGVWEDAPNTYTVDLEF
ncbi:hypothetical protein STSO111631_17875 [Stackebrandtia soli]